MATYWHNSDQLLVKFGRQEGTVGGITGIGFCSEYEVPGESGRRCTEVVLNTMTAIPSSAASGAGIVSDTVTIPNGARIEAVEVIAFTAVDSAADNTVINLGLVDQDRSTEIDYNGLLAAIPQASMDPAGETHYYDSVADAYGGTYYGGALIGTTLTNTGYLSVDYDTAVPTAGIVKIRVYWFKPASSTSP